MKKIKVIEGTIANSLKAIWGNIGGDIENQDDLVEYIDEKVSSSEGTLDTKITSETNNRVSADVVLQNNINQEKSLRESADQVLSDRVTTEKTQRESSDETLSSNISANSYAISNEVSNRTSEILRVDGRIDTEATTRQTADSSLQSAINQEVIDRKTAIENEETSRVENDTLLNGRIDNLPKYNLYKGTLGVGGTITSLPTASADTVGHVYRVISNGIYGVDNAVVNDLFIGVNDSKTWLINDIPVIDNGITTFTDNFISNNITYSQMKLTGITLPGIGKVYTIDYDDTQVYSSRNTPSWVDRSYQRIYLTSDPSEDLLTWLKNNTTNGGYHWVLIPSGYVGTVTKIETGTGLSGGPITSTGTISVNYSEVQAKLTPGERISINNNTISTTANAVSVSNTGTATDEVQYITIDGVEKKLSGSSITEYLKNASVENNKLTLVKNDSSSIIYNPDIPTKTSQLQNDSGFLTSHQSLSEYRKWADQDIIDAQKQPLLTQGQNIVIENNVISAIDTTYTQGEKIEITNNTISTTANEVSVSNAGTSTDEVSYITIDGTEKKIAGEPSEFIKSASVSNKILTLTNKDGSTVTFTDTGSIVSVSNTGTSTDTVQYITIDGVERKLAGGGTGSGTVTEVRTGAGLTGGPITSSGEISHSTSGVTAGTYTKVTVNNLGHVTNGTTLGASDIPNLTLSKITDITATATNLNYTSGVTSNIQTQLNNKQSTLSAQTAYSAKGSSTKVPQITTNSLGQVTGITEVAIAHQDISGKQDTLVSGTNIKTVNSTTLLGSGNLTTPLSRIKSGVDVSTSNWSGSSTSYFTKTITLSNSGITSDDNPIVDIDLSEVTTSSSAKTKLTEYSKILKVTTGTNSITLYALEVPTEAFKIMIKY